MSSNSNTSDSNELDQGEEFIRFHEGQKNSHKANDSKDQRTISNKIAREEQRENEPDKEPEEVKAMKEDPTMPAKMHGNEPSRGAEIDAEILAEEQEELERKGKA